MILATTKVENYERFLEIFSTKGAEKRALHGSKGATVFRDPVEDDRVWSSSIGRRRLEEVRLRPRSPAILQEAGHIGKPQAAELGGRYAA